MRRLVLVCGLLSLPAAHAKEPAMSVAADDASAYAAARAHFARALRVAPKHVVPLDLAHRDDTLKSLQIGALHAFVFERGRRRIHGFASADGQVVQAKTPKTWGAFFKTAQVLDPAQATDAPGLARRLVWLNQQGDLVLDAGADLTDFSVNPGASNWPTIARDAEGATLTYSYRPRQRRSVARPRRVRLRISSEYQVVR
jgi:hypothetical protein